MDGTMSSLEQELSSGAAMAFLAGWSGGSVLGLEPGQRVDRRALTARLSERARRDANFRRGFLAQPRFLSALAVHEGLGISPVAFLWQVEAVHVLEEEPGLHWLVLPACHRGCEMLRGSNPSPPAGACRACGKPDGRAGTCAAAPPPGATRGNGPRDADERTHDVDDVLVRSAESDASSRSRLLADPTASFAEACQALFGMRSGEELGIKEVRVEAETDAVLSAVLRARHDPGVQPSAAPG